MGLEVIEVLWLRGVAGGVKGLMKTLVALCLCSLSISASAQLKYASAKYGVSFQYPKGYVLKEGALDNKDAGMGYLGPTPMEFVKSGGVRVATIEAPAGSYSGTDFNNAFFTVSMNSHLTKGECEQFADRPSAALLKDLMVKIPKDPIKTIGGIEFHGFRMGLGGLGHQFSGVYYHGFSRGSCYELGYGMATSGYGAVDGMKQVDSGKVFLILEKVLGTVRIHSPASP